MSRLKEAERKKIIDDYKKGIRSKDYDVYESKNQKGRYTIKRKALYNNTNEQQQQPTNIQQQDDQQQQEEGNNDEVIVEENNNNNNPFLDDKMYIPTNKMSKNIMFREMQMMMNGMFLEQFKLLRKEQKHSDKERKNLGEQTYQIYKLLRKINDEPDQQHQQPTRQNKTNNIEHQQHDEQPTQQHDDNDEEEVVIDDVIESRNKPTPKAKFNLFL
jgi:hypothetical protein